MGAVFILKRFFYPLTSAVFFLILSFGLSSLAKGAKVKAQVAVVVNQGAAVYAEAHFDAQVMATLKAGKKVFISRKVYGPFYKIRVRRGVWGYVSDIDVRPLGKKKKSKQRYSKKDLKKPPQKKHKVDSRAIYEKKFITFSLGQLSLKEQAFGKSFSSSPLTVFGGRYIKPGLILGQLPSEISAVFYPQAPDYYKTHTGKGTSGLLAIIEAVIHLPFVIADHRYFYLGLGPMLAYSDYFLIKDNKSENLQNWRFGAVLALGWTQKVTDQIALNVDYKLYREDQNYSAFYTSLLLSF